MPHELRRIRKTRGSRTQGYGRVGQHRKTGSKGARKSGRHKHLWSYILRYEPNYYGKKGFTSPQSLRRKEKVINIGKLEELVKKFGVAREKGQLIDLESLGYTKLLGSGKITKPLTVKVASISESAAAKVKEAGGQILSEDQEQEE